MRFRDLVLPLLLVSVGGCSAMLEKDATATLEKQCVAKGKHFVKTDSTRSDNPIYSKAEVEGVCVGPDDPRYVAPTGNVPPTGTAAPAMHT